MYGFKNYIHYKPVIATKSPLCLMHKGLLIIFAICLQGKQPVTYSKVKHIDTGFSIIGTVIELVEA